MIGIGSSSGACPGNREKILALNEHKETFHKGGQKYEVIQVYVV